MEELMIFTGFLCENEKGWKLKFPSQDIIKIVAHGAQFGMDEKR